MVLLASGMFSVLFYNVMTVIYLSLQVVTTNKSTVTIAVPIGYNPPVP